jgi:hypothetical protein
MAPLWRVVKPIPFRDGSDTGFKVDDKCVELHDKTEDQQRAFDKLVTEGYIIPWKE